mmetsp:Transcript_22748/g.40250  ORF Transcript_22748/g.40250 Transcript_22748/m.40250 type:complete len:121 (-) Transcript_22748:176-538(-)|eukprot:CAMPEP_0197525182 /NCGR_PEP_ID=MMETSP1318-20131121/10671_1 /TAXON_ID=552666 /ORGANISM="Partenskyella glossopodia, Strain RCC365" /LENGTH=120 /DNA_ID=CAMNT_0043078367 /DNA_START=59 /DNA_END=421 /DNA_ORIENTATION=+
MSTHFRGSRLGTSLSGSLQEMLDNNELSEEDANKFMDFFDESINQKLKDVTTKSSKSKKKKMQVKAGLHSYNFVDNVWNFVLEDAVFTNLKDINNPEKTVDLPAPVKYMKITAVDSKLHK